MIIQFQEFFNNFLNLALRNFINKTLSITALGVAFLLPLSLHNAKAQIVDSAFYGWTVYELQENELTPKQCYIVAHPIKSNSSELSRLKPYLMIARFQRKRNEEINVYGGFEYKRNGKIFVAVDKEQFQLLAGKDTAWAKSKHDDIAIIEALLHSSKVKIRSDSAVGNFAIDEYSLQGITKAYARMKTICK